MTPADAWQMIKRRAEGAGIQTPICCHTFRATGITAYLEQRRDAGEGPADGRPRVAEDDQALRPHQRPDHARRGRADRDLTDGPRVVPVSAPGTTVRPHPTAGRVVPLARRAFREPRPPPGPAYPTAAGTTADAAADPGANRLRARRPDITPRVPGVGARHRQGSGGHRAALSAGPRPPPGPRRAPPHPRRTGPGARPPSRATPPSPRTLLATRLPQRHDGGQDPRLDRQPRHHLTPSPAVTPDIAWRRRNRTRTLAKPDRPTGRGSLQSHRTLAVYSPTRSPAASAAAVRLSGYTTNPR